MSSEADIKEIHDQMLVLLKRFHEICIENGIKYSLHGGTLLGAIREKGFIPWDDDADVSLIRSEYERLCAVMADFDEEDGFFFHDHTRAEFQIPRFYLRKPGKPLVWVDLFIYDYISERLMFQKIKIGITILLTGFSKTEVAWEITQRKTQYAEWKKRIYYLIYMLGKPFPFKWKINLRNKFTKNCFCGNKKFVYRSNDQYIGMVKVLSSDIVIDYETVPFENIELMVSSKYQVILESSYGKDYMIPKYGEEEIITHDIIRKALEGER